MPINFEPAAPVGLGYAQGMAEQAAQGNQLQLQANAMGANLLAQQQHTQQASYDAAAERGARSQMLQAQMAHQEEMANRQVENQVYLQQQQLTQAENMRLQRVRNVIADIQGNTSLNDEEKNDLILQARGVASPLEQRAARTTLKIKEEQYKQFMEQSAQRRAVQSMDATARARHYQDQMVPVPEHLGGGMLFTGDDGHTIHVKPPTETAERPDPSELTMQQYLQHYHEIEKEVNRMHAGPNAPGGEMGPADRRAAIRAALEGAGLAPDATAHGQRLSAARAARPSRRPGVGAGGTGNDVTLFGGNGGDGEGGPPPTAPPGAARPDQPLQGPPDARGHTAPMRPRAEWSPNQQATMDEFRRLYERTHASVANISTAYGRPRPSVEEQNRFARHHAMMAGLQRAERLYTLRGSYANMTPAEQQTFMAIMNGIRQADQER